MWTARLFSIQGLSLILCYAGTVLAAGNTTCLSSQLDWYTTAVGETPCMTYQRLRQICDSAYQVGNFAATTPGDHCTDQVSDCCCNSVAFALSMLCMNCQEDATPGDVAGIDAPPGTYTAYLNNSGSVCSPITNQSLPTSVQAAVCNLNIKIDNLLYNRSYWSDGSWYYRWTADYAVEQQAANNNNTFTVCPNQVLSSASLSTATSIVQITSVGSVVSTSSGNTVSATSANSATSSSTQKAIIGGAVGGGALAIIAVLGGLYCIRRSKQPRMTQDTPSSFLGQLHGDRPVYGTTFTDTEPETVHRYSSLSPVRRLDSSRDSSLPMMTSLSPERTQSLNASSTGTSYFLSDNMSEAAAPFIREDDAGTLIPPNVTERLPPAYHPSWVSRNSPRSSNYIDDQSLLGETIQTTHSDATRSVRGSLPQIPQEKGPGSRWNSSS